MTVLVTGAKGMIGSELVKGLLSVGYRVIGVDRGADPYSAENYRHFELDLAEGEERLSQILCQENVNRVIHLAALAHRKSRKKPDWDQYYHANVEASRNVFRASGDLPVLYISTVDVFGLYDGLEPLTGESPISPVSDYGKSKALAEDFCRRLKHYDIFRFSPVYSDTVKRDIQKRYYLYYPQLAYQIGSGSAFEILNVRKAASEMIDWCEKKPSNRIRIVKDDRLMWTPAYIEREKQMGRARTVVHIPGWGVRAGYRLLKKLLGEKEQLYLLNKAAYPLRTMEIL